MGEDTTIEAFAEWVPHVVWIARADGFTTYINKQGVDYLGLDSNRDLGWDWVEHVHPDDREMARERWKQACGADAPVSLEYRIQTRDGSYRWNVVSATPVKAADGTVRQWVGTYTDVDAHRTAVGKFKEAERSLVEREKELDESRAHLARAQAVAHIGSVEIDLIGGQDRWSDELYRILGRDPQSLPPRYEFFAPQVHPDDAAAVLAARSASEQGNILPPSEFRIIRTDGEIRWLHRQSDLFRNEAGAAVKVIATLQDVTERRAAEEALRHREADLWLSQRHLERAQQIGKVASAEVDLRTGAVYWSDVAYTMFGLPKQSPAPNIETILSVIHPDDRERIRALTARTRSGELGPPSEFRIVAADGSIRWIHRLTVLIRNEAGTPTSILATMQDITERKMVELELRRHEAELRASREHLARAQRVGNIGSAEVNLDTQEHIWSDGLYRLLGIEVGSLAPGFENFLDFVHPDDRKIVSDVQASLRRGIAVSEVEFRVRRADGEIRWFRRLAETIGDGERASNRIVISFQDVTDRRQMEDDLRISREHLAAAQRVGGLGSGEVDLVNLRVHWSDGLYAVLGLDPATPPSGEIFLALVHPDDRDRVRDHRAKSLRGEPPEPIEFRIVRKDGSVRWVYHTVEMLRDRAGNPEKLIGTDLDITDRKRDEIILREREGQLRESQEHLAHAQRVGKIGSIEVDIGKGESRWSEEVFSLLGLDPATTKPGQEAFLSAIHPDDREALRTRRDRLMRGLNNPAEEFRIVKPDTGEVRWLQFQSGPVSTGQGPLSRTIAILQDVTELHHARAERSEIERRLLQAQKMEAVGNLTGGIAHDFNNLLTVILGRLDLVENELRDRPELKDWIRIAMNAARRGAALTRSMLAFARQQPLQPAAIDIAGSLHDMVGLLQRTLGEAIEIKVVYPPDLWACEADPAQLQTALLNLALNARDAMPHGGKLTIDARNFRLDNEYAARNADVVAGDYVALSVSDTGVGMSRDVIEHAFEPFFTTKEVGKGSGLGLSMVYGYVKQSGGHIKIYSEIGSGTTVTMYLPRSTTSGDVKGEPLPAVDRRPSGGREELLVVEDDDDMRDLTVTVLERLGYTVHSVRQATEAIPLLDQHRDIALLLTDISLPGGMNGRELAERALKIRADLKVLYMSGYSEDAIIHQGRLDPGIRLLQKPFHNEQLADEIRSVLAGA